MRRLCLTYAMLGLVLACSPARADSCSQRFGGSCRTEVFRLTTVGDASVASRPRAQKARSRKTVTRRVRESRIARVTQTVPVATPVNQTVPVPRPAPQVEEASPVMTPRLIVDESFNIFMALDYADNALLEGLKLRQQIPSGSE
jgi:hypothetical protein